MVDIHDLGVSQIFLLGKLTVDGWTVPANSNKLAQVIALLALHPDRPVNNEMVAAEFGEPGRSPNTTQVLMSHIRDCGIEVVCRRNRGYRLGIKRNQVDVFRLIKCAADSSRLFRKGQTRPATRALEEGRGLAARGTFLEGVRLGPVLSKWARTIAFSQETLAAGCYNPLRFSTAQ